MPDSFNCQNQGGLFKVIGSHRRRKVRDISETVQDTATAHSTRMHQSPLMLRDITFSPDARPPPSHLHGFVSHRDATTASTRAANAAPQSIIHVRTASIIGQWLHHCAAQIAQLNRRPRTAT